MLNFGISSGAAAFRASLRSWLECELPTEWRQSECHRLPIDDVVAIRLAWGKKLFAHGWAGPGWPKKYGGLGLGPEEHIVYLDELARADAVEIMDAISHGEHMAVAIPPFDGEMPYLDQKHISGVFDGVRVPPGARLLLAIARIRTAELALVVIDLERDEVTLEVHETVHATRRVGTVTLERCPFRSVISWPADDGCLEQARLRFLLVRAATAIGGGLEVIRRTAHHVTLREQFGQPLAAFQAIRRRLADMYGGIENARAFNAVAAWRLGEDEPGASTEVASAFLAASSAYERACEGAIQCHGGIGYTWEGELHFWYRDALFTKMQDGARLGVRRRVWEDCTGPRRRAENSCG